MLRAAQVLTKKSTSTMAGRPYYSHSTNYFKALSSLAQPQHLQHHTGFRLYRNYYREHHLLTPSFTFQSCRGISSSHPQTPNESGGPRKEGDDEKKLSTSKMTVVIKGLKSVYASISHMVMNPKQTWQAVKDEAHHYWVGSKLLWSEIKITKQILGRVVKGHELTRRERRQLVRTSTDLFRLVPFAVFVIVPFMELLLPLALKLFPNMLPSTFEDSLKKEEAMKKELQMRLAVAKFMQETLQELASKKATSTDASSSAKDLLHFIEQARLGVPIPHEKVIEMAKFFKDELTLANISRPQLLSMCKFMGLQTFGSDSFLRFQLRTKFRAIKDDDRRILWEGVDSLNTLELREACQERGMKSIGITQFKLKNQLSEWLELSTQKGLPISLLIMSRAFMLTSASDEPEEVLKSSMSSLDPDTINEIVIATASEGEEKSVDIQKRKIESLKFQQEMIDEELARKESKAKAVTEAAAAAAAAAAQPPVAQSAGNNTLVEAHDNYELQEFEKNKSRESELISQVATSSQLNEHNKGSNPIELTIQEMQALTDLARGSPLQREKSELYVLQATIDALNPVASSDSKEEKSNLSDLAGGEETSIVKAPLAHSNDCVPASINEANNREEGGSREIKEDKSVARMKAVLDSMLRKLSLHIDSTEKVVGDKLNVLDKDGDGELSAEELRDAIVKLLRKNYSVQEAEQLVAILDNDKDGKISLVELLHYIQRKKESLEVEKEMDEVSKSAATVPPSSSTISSS